MKAVLKNIPPESNEWHKLLDDARINPQLLKLSNDRTRVSIEQFARLQANTMSLLNDEMLGYCDRALPVGCWDMMLHACIHSHTLGEFAQRYCQFYNLLTWNLRVELKQNTNNIEYILRPKNNHSLDPYVYELCLHNTHRLFTWIIGHYVAIESVKLSYSPPEHASVYTILFSNAPVHFNSPYCGLVFQNDILSSPVIQNHASLRKFLRHPAYELIMVAIESESWSSKIQSIIGKNISTAPSFDILAEQLGIHPQTLRRRLADERTTYRNIKNHLRRDVAIYYLAKPGMSLEEASERSGFSETSSFFRAFKNWTGLTPCEYRKESVGDHDQIP
ncbi:AraC family transcriptional regulator [Zhongshania marina]|uniref:AraC family transcriptional regulator n=1 Tax=Zhongshania marina TaxID=2304603 RepID=UPI001313DC9D